MRRFISRMPCLYIKRDLITFIPPAVEPAEPPTKLASIRIIGSAPGQPEKSDVVNPVVVAIETV